METPKLLFRTSEVALLAGVEQRRIERLLESENIFLDGIALRPGEKKHRRFSELDVIRVAIILRLNDHGVEPAKVASGLADQIVDPYQGETGFDKIAIDKRIDIILRTLYFTHVHVWFDEQQEKFTYASYCDRIDGSREYFGTPEATRQMFENSRDVYIVLNISRIVQNFLDGLKNLSADKE